MQQQKNDRYKVYGLYTIAFLIISAVIFSQFIYYGKTMIEYHDSLQQYYAGFQYFVGYVHKAIKTLFSTGHLSLPMWDASIGMGGDVLTALNYYVIGDPINLIGVCFPQSALPVVYQILILFRLYLAGVLFIAFCKKIGYNKIYVVLGASMYSFSVFALYSAVMYAAFPNVLIYLPLLLIAVERVFRREGSGMLVISIALCLISNFYFCYMLAILLVVYCVLRYACINYPVFKRENPEAKAGAKAADFFKWVGRMIPPLVLGALISCVILIPDLLVFMNQGRGAGQVVESYTHYTKWEYIEILSSLFSPKIASNYNLLGLCPLVFLAVMLLFQKSGRKRKTRRILRVGFILSGICLLFPIFGYALNGFAYVNNRWIFGLVFLSGVTVTVLFEDMLHLSKKNQCVLIAGEGIYFLLYLILRPMKIQMMTVGLAWNFFLLATVLFLNYMEWKKGVKTLVLTAAGLICVMYYGFTLYNPIDTTIMSSKVDSEDMKNLKKYKTGGAATAIKDKDFYRVDVTDGDTLNEGLLFGYPSVAFYYSLYEGTITDFNKQLNNSAMTVPNMSHGNKGRSYLNALCNVKYAVGDGSQDMPYGFVPYKEYEMADGSKKYIYKSANVLPFAYVTDQYVDAAKFEQYSSLQKEQAMMQAPVVDKESAGSLKESTPVFQDGELAYTVESVTGGIFENNKVKVTNRNAKVCLSVNVPAGKEVFVQGLDLTFKAYNPQDNRKYYYKKDASVYEKRMEDYLYSTWREPASLVVTANMGKRSDTATLYLEHYKYFWNQDQFLLCLGNAYSGSQKITLTFSEPGEYSFSSLKVLTEDMAQLKQQIQNQQKSAVKNVKFASNYIEGTAESTGNNMAVLSLPYSKGWQAEVDGKKVDLVKVNTMWTGIYLKEAGTHKIVLHYRTPGLKVGTLISLVSLLFAAGFYYMIHRKRRHS